MHQSTHSAVVIRYLPSAQRFAETARSTTRLLASLVIIVLVALSIAAQGLARLASELDGGTSMGLMAVSWLVTLLAGALIAAAGYQLWIIARLPRRIPEVAVRMDANGIWSWPLAGLESFVPWEAVHGVSASREGLKFRVAKEAPKLPGTIGLRSGHGMAHFTAMQRSSSPGIKWEWIESVDRPVLDRAVQHFTQGRLAVEAG